MTSCAACLSLSGLSHSAEPFKVHPRCRKWQGVLLFVAELCSSVSVSVCVCPRVYVCARVHTTASPVFCPGTLGGFHASLAAVNMGRTCLLHIVSFSYFPRDTIAGSVFFFLIMWLLKETVRFSPYCDVFCFPHFRVQILALCLHGDRCHGPDFLCNHTLLQ